MKVFIAVLALVAAVSADVKHLYQQNHHQAGDANAQILKQNSEVGPQSHNFDFQTDNGIAAQESGALRNPGQENEVYSSQGGFSYTAPDGQLIQVSYNADEYGFQPQGAHLPTTPAPPPIPDYIIRSIEYTRKHHPELENEFAKTAFAQTPFAKRG